MSKHFPNASPSVRLATFHLLDLNPPFPAPRLLFCSLLRSLLIGCAASQARYCHEPSLQQAGGLAPPALRPLLSRFPTSTSSILNIHRDRPWLLWILTRLLRRSQSLMICAILFLLALSAALRLLIPTRVTTKQFRAFQTALTPKTALSRSSLSAAVVTSFVLSTSKAVVSVFKGSCMFTSD